MCSVRLDDLIAFMCGIGLCFCLFEVHLCASNAPALVPLYLLMTSFANHTPSNKLHHLTTSFHNQPTEVYSNLLSIIFVYVIFGMLVCNVGNVR